VTDEELEALSREVGVPVDTLRTFAGMSDPANAHLFTREALVSLLEDAELDAKVRKRLADETNAIDVDLDDL